VPLVEVEFRLKSIWFSLVQALWSRADFEGPRPYIDDCEANAKIQQLVRLYKLLKTLSEQSKNACILNTRLQHRLPNYILYISAKNVTFYICYNLVRCRPILLILGRNLPQQIWDKHKSTAHHISFHMFVLYLVKSSNDFTSHCRSTKSNTGTMSTHKSQIVASCNVHIIRASVWSLVHQFSHRGAVVHAMWSIAAWSGLVCISVSSARQSGDAEVRILI